jgi:glyoxylase-like metal-dependent hydrolase (beta-lactamase superfamily II)
MPVIELATGLFLMLGAVNTGLLVSGDRALLIDCCDTVTGERLAASGVKRVEMILCTQHRRTNVAGAYPFIENGAELVVPAKERALFEDTDAYWADWKNRWHLYQSQPGPEVLARPMKVSRAVSGGDVVEWRDHRIRVLDTPGATMGAVSYVIEAGGKTFCFSGDVLYGPGKVWDLYSLQKGYDYGVVDYHGFLGNLRLLDPSLETVASCGAGALVPSHGKVITDPKGAAKLTADRLHEAYLNYSSVSSLNHWFPEMMKDAAGDPRRMAFSPKGELPDYVRHIPQTTYVLISESREALVMDCGDDMVVEAIRKMMEKGEIKTVEAAWVTHYHDDHVDGIGRLHAAFNCPVIVEEHQTDILAHPERYLLPCISPTALPVNRVVRDGESWKWREFTLTAFHFTGQTLYHSALLAEGRGKRILFTGDSFSPSGIDDYCPGNRNLLGKGIGYDLCLDVVRRVHPDIIINAHMPFSMTLADAQIDHMKKILAERETIFAGLLPWENSNFGTDMSWARAYPYQQSVFPGSAFTFEARFTNHASKQSTVRVEPVLPHGWTWSKASSTPEITIPPGADGSARITVNVPAKAGAGTAVIPFRVIWNGRYLGQIRHTVVQVMRE